MLSNFKELRTWFIVLNIASGTNSQSVFPKWVWIWERILFTVITQFYTKGKLNMYDVKFICKDKEEWLTLM